MSLMYISTTAHVQEWLMVKQTKKNTLYMSVHLNLL